MKLKDKLKSFSEEVGEDKIEKLIGYSSLRGLIMSIQEMAQEIDEEIEDELSNLVQKIEKKWQDLQNQDLNNTENTKSELNSQQTKPLLCDGKDSMKIEGDGGVEHITRNVEVSIENSRGIGNKTADTQIQNEINKDYVKEGTEVKNENQHI